MTRVYCGGGAIAGVAGELAKLENADLLPPEDVEAPTPGTPPEGFDTWEEYQDYKCQAAWFIWGQLRALAVANSALAGLQATAAVVAPVAAGLLGAWPVALTPVGFVALVAGMVAVGAVSIYGYYAFTQWVAWWDDNKADIICELYTSGSAAAAMTAINNAVEDGIQAIEWVGLLSGFAPSIGPVMGLIMGEVTTNSFVSPLFRLVVSVTMPDAVCDCGELQDAWHFDSGVEGWTFTSDGAGHVTFTHGHQATPDPVDPDDYSDGCLECTLASDDPGQSEWASGTWTLTFNPASRPVGANGVGFHVDGYKSLAAHSWRIRIVYTDDSEDLSSANGTNGWASDTVYVTAPNYGKSIESVNVLTWWGSQQTGNYTFRLDRANLVGL